MFETGEIRKTIMRKILYLDQNYASNLAKARYNFIKEPEEAGLWLELYDILKSAVSADKIICPESYFHSKEAMYDSRLGIPIKQVIGELSLGLKFLHWRRIMESQIEDAARLFLNKKLEQTEEWIKVFQSNPQASVKSRMQDVSDKEVRVDVHIRLPEEVIDYERREKDEFEAVGRELIKKYCEKPMEWSRLVLESKKSTIDGFMGASAVQKIVNQIRSDSLLEQMNGYDNYARLLLLFDKLVKIGIDPQNRDMITRFLESKELLDSPFIEIYSALWAIIAECRRIQGRDMRSSDFYDVPILAMALPPCDIIATDGFMKEVNNNLLKFNNKYKTEIFSASREDLMALQKRVANC